MAESLQHAVPLASMMKTHIISSMKTKSSLLHNSKYWYIESPTHRTEQNRTSTCEVLLSHHLFGNLSPPGTCCMPHNQHPSFLCLRTYSLTTRRRRQQKAFIRGIRCSLGFQIINLARPPESRESPTLTFSLVRHWPEQWCLTWFA